MTSEPNGQALEHRRRRGIFRRLRRHAVCAAVAAPGFAAICLILPTACSAPGGVWGALAIEHAPRKPAKAATSDLAGHAKARFWEVFHAGRYEDAPEALRLLEAAYLQFPYDPELALLIGHTHLWLVSERGRVEKPDPRVTDHLVLARYYFDQAKRLSPEDRRIDGWLGSVELALGTVHREQEFIRRGFFTIRDAWKAYPAFNGFTYGYVMSTASRDSDRFAQALRAQWGSVDACSRGRIRPDDPGVSADEAVSPADAVCANSDKAPHNFEGFWWNLGLMELKAGHLERGRTCLQNASVSPVYASWPFRDRLERDLAEADSLAERFAAGDESADDRLLFNTTASCVACHQQ